MSIVPANRRSRGVAHAAMSGALGSLPLNIGQIKSAFQAFKSVANEMRKSRESKTKPSPKASPKQAKAAKTEAPVSQGFSSNNLVRTQVLRSTANSVCLRGATVLGQVSSGSIAPTVPTCLFFAASNPLTFIDRLQTLASTYDKYVYKNVVLRFVPQCPTSTAGQIAIAIDRDYMDKPQTTSWAQALSYESVTNGSVWAGHSCKMGRDTHELRTYFTNFTGDTTLRESEQFKFYAYAVGVPASTNLGFLMLEYEIELISPVYAEREVVNNLQSFGMTSATVFLNYGGSTQYATAAGAGLPLLANAPGDLFEIITSGGIVSNTAILIGPTGPVYVPSGSTSSTNSVQLFARVTNLGILVFADYTSAVSSNTSLALYNSSGLTQQLCNGPATYRQLTSSLV